MFGTRRYATFRPKQMDTLRECMRPLIGRTFTFIWAGKSGDDEPYPGQDRWMLGREYDASMPEDAQGRWFPDEDLDDARVLDEDRPPWMTDATY